MGSLRSRFAAETDCARRTPCAWRIGVESSRVFRAASGRSFLRNMERRRKFQPRNTTSNQTSSWNVQADRLRKLRTPTECVRKSTTKVASTHSSTIRRKNEAFNRSEKIPKRVRLPTIFRKRDRTLYFQRELRLANYSRDGTRVSRCSQTDAQFSQRWRKTELNRWRFATTRETFAATTNL